MASVNNITITIRHDDAVRVVIEALAILSDAYELIPEWNTLERAEIERRGQALARFAGKRLRTDNS